MFQCLFPQVVTQGTRGGRGGISTDLGHIIYKAEHHRSLVLHDSGSQEAWLVGMSGRSIRAVRRSCVACEYLCPCVLWWEDHSASLPWLPKVSSFSVYLIYPLLLHEKLLFKDLVQVIILALVLATIKRSLLLVRGTSPSV